MKKYNQLINSVQMDKTAMNKKCNIRKIFRAVMKKLLQKIIICDIITISKKWVYNNMDNEIINENENDELYFVKLTVDLAFKYIFGEPKNSELLKSLLKDITKLPIERLEELGFMAEELHRDSMDDHKTIVDVRAVLTDKTQAAVEMQVQNQHNMDKRSLHIWAKMYAAQLKKNGKYHELAKCICINITAFDFTKESKGHSKYVVKEDETNEPFMTDFEIHFVELPKRDKVGNSRLRKWMALFSSASWEEMKRNAEGDEIMGQVYNQARQIAMNESKRIEVENRERWIIDQNSIRHYEREQGKLESEESIAIRMLKNNRPLQYIMEDTGMTEEEIITLKSRLS